MRYWIGVAAGDHVKRGEEGSFVMFAHGKHEAVKKLQPGDAFAYYAPRAQIKAGEVIRCFVAIGTIDKGEPRDSGMMENQVAWSRPATYIKSHNADVYPLLDELTFVKDPAHWGMAFRRSLFEVSRQDFMLIARAMGVEDRIGQKEPKGS